MKIVTLQPASQVDFLTEDGQELTRKPYPFHVRPDGLVERQDVWQGSVFRVIGFLERLDGHKIDVTWNYARRDPQRVVGMYVVTADDRGSMSVHLSAIETVHVADLPDPE